MVGFYDSGVGGLTILEEVLKLQPNFSYIYFADTEALPLGDKSIEYIRKRLQEACVKLFNLGCNIVVLACNTASVTSIRYIQQVWLRENYPNNQVLSIAVPLVELVNDDLFHLKNDDGLLFSTLATHNSGFYQYKLTTDGFLKCQSVPMSGFADAIEESNTHAINRIINHTITINCIDPKSIKYIILACTHYKWAMHELQNVFPNTKIVEPSQIVALKLLNYLSRHPEYNNSLTEARFITTSKSDNFYNFVQKIELLKITNPTR